MSDTKKPQDELPEEPTREESEDTTSDRRKFLGLAGAAAAAAVVGGGAQSAEAASIKSKILARIKREVDSGQSSSTGLYGKEATYSKGYHNYQKGGFNKSGGYAKGIRYSKSSTTLPVERGEALPGDGAAQQL